MMRIRSSAAYLALVAGLGLALAGCGKIGEVRAMKAFKDANKLYAASDWKPAADKYEQAIAMNPEFATIYFYLGNSYDNLYRPARKGEPANDALLQKAVANYKLASEKITDNEKLRQLALEYLVASYGPDKLNDATMAEPVVKRMIELSPKEPTNYFALAKIYEDSGEYELAEQTLLQSKEAKSNDPAVYMQLAGFYNRKGDFAKTIDALGERIKVEPNNPEAHYTLATYYWDEAYRDFRLNDKDKLQYVMSGVAAVEKAIQIKPDYMEAITYKGLLLRLQANLEKDRAKQLQLLKEADDLRDKANEMRKAKQAA